MLVGPVLPARAPDQVELVAQREKVLGRVVRKEVDDAVNLVPAATSRINAKTEQNRLTTPSMRTNSTGLLQLNSNFRENLQAGVFLFASTSLSCHFSPATRSRWQGGLIHRGPDVPLSA